MAETVFSEDRTRVRVTVPIAEGPRLIVASVDVQGAHLLSQAELRAAVVLAPGQPWDAERARAGQRAIERLYVGRAYHGATVGVESRRSAGGASSPR